MNILGVFLVTLISVRADQSQLQSRYQCNESESSEHPHHCHLMDLAAKDPEQFASDLRRWSNDIGLTLPDYNAAARGEEASHVIDAPDVMAVKRNLRTNFSKKTARSMDASSSALPTITAHGMGDSCFNEGSMQYITNRVADLTNQYATCIPTGDNHHDDVLNGYFMSMNENIDIFAKKVKQDPKLSNGFHGIGFSQGNNVLRGYIAKYNDPPVHTFISINGVNAGISAVPYCIPSMTNEAADSNATEDISNQLSLFKLHSKICDGLMEIASHRAYSEFSQTHSFQANYWRDPRPVERISYQTYSQLAELGNENPLQNSALNDNFKKTQAFVWILAKQDSIVWPKEGEQWGAPNSEAEDPFTDILSMKETEWYEKDLFGLKAADEAGKFFYEEFEGDHLQFDFNDFDDWVRKYLLED